MQREGNQNNNPSRVIHFRNVTPRITQSDLAGLCNRHGRLTNIIMLRNKNQALVEFADLASSIAFIQEYSRYLPTIHQIVVYPTYSQHQELTSSVNNVAAAAQDTTPPSPVLLVTILNPLYPITVEVLGQIFNSYDRGTVQKIIIFNSQKGAGNLQALIKFSSVENAGRAKDALNGKNIYTGCCTLQIQFSTNTDITVRENSERSFDFTSNSLPTTNRRIESDRGVLVLNELLQLPLDLRPPPDRYGGGGEDRYGGGYGGSYNSSNNYGSGRSYDYEGGRGYGGGSYDRNTYGPPPSSYGQSGGYSNYGGGGGGYGGYNDRRVLIVHGFPPDKIQCDDLFHLFSNYGVITRIKILNQKPDTALIQFQDGQQATTALGFLKNIRLYGSTLDVNYSKHDHINSPISSSDGGDGKTVDYENSSLNRVKANSSSAVSFFRTACEPSSVLHVSNLSPSTTAENLTSLLSQAGEVVALKIFESPSSSSSGSGERRIRHMALVQYPSVDIAVEAMCQLHNSLLDNHNIRLSFTKSKI